MDEDAPTPEELLARSLRYHRAERLHITAQQLADRVAELGGTLSRQAISKIENRARSVSVDELMVLARALGMAPLLLLFPEGTRTDRITGHVQCWPGQVMDVWEAALWFTGEAYPGEDVATHWAVPLYLRRQHDRWIKEYQYLLTERSLWEAHGEDRDKAGRLAAAALRRVRDIRADMRRHGQTPPTLADDLRHVDERRHVFMSPEEADRHAADNPGDLRFVDYNALRDPDSPYPPVKPGHGERIRQAQEFARNVDPGPTPEDPKEGEE